MDTVVACTAARRLLGNGNGNGNATHDHDGHRAHPHHGFGGAAARAPAPPLPPPSRAESFPTLLPVFILFVLLLCFLSIFLLRDLLHFFSLCLRRRRRLRLLRATTDTTTTTTDPHKHKPAGLDPAVLATFPTVRWFDERHTHQQQQQPGNAAECAVCLAEFAAGDAVRLLTTVCRHAFHAPCIDSWLRDHTTCPVCRSELDAQPPATTTTPRCSGSGGGDGDGGGGRVVVVAIVVDDGRQGDSTAASVADTDHHVHRTVTSTAPVGGGVPSLGPHDR